jgi:uncharacterized phage protein (TIGR02218 family)
MKTLDSALQAHLASGLTTLCLCWRLTLLSGERMGFTDHDFTLSFDGTDFEAQSGFTGSEIESSIGLAVDNLEATGALSSDQISEQCIRAGDFDHALVEVWRVNWHDVSQRVLERKGHLGEVTYGQGKFTAELRGLAHILNQPKGRLFQHGCDALLGDSRCGINLSVPELSVDGAIISVLENGVDVSGAGGFADDWFARGILRFTAGANLGRSVEIRSHKRVAALARLEFWSVPKFAMNVGDAVAVVTGCDKQFATCRTKFNNAANFRGHPTMPGTDFLLKVAGR